MIDIQDARGHTPFHCAAQLHNQEMVQFLLERGAESQYKKC